MTAILERETGAAARAAASRIVVREADSAGLDEVFRLRYDVYATELNQYAQNASGVLRDAPDARCVYLTAHGGGRLAGFIGITCPGRRYSLDKYIPRDAIPVVLDDSTYEVRVLTIAPSCRGSALALLLMYAAMRWIEHRGGRHIIAIGRQEVLDLYRRVGLVPCGVKVQAGAVAYELMSCEVGAIGRQAVEQQAILARLRALADWQLDAPFQSPEVCYHGGAFFDAVGPGFETLERSRDVINADVLDAWFPPSPRVIAALREYLPWLVRTSPPTNCEGMIAAIARARGVSGENILPGAGSSDLIFLALRAWLTPDSRVLLLDPTYGEYAHVLERVIGCRVDRLSLARERNYDVPLDELRDRMRRQYDLVVLVNPNSPTGRLVPGTELLSVLAHAPPATRVWIDETYIDYAGTEHSLECRAARSGNIVICKSMSKVYALSGVRAAYLCGPRDIIAALRPITPPWAVGLPGQLAAVKALEDPAYYAAQHRKTHALRNAFATQLAALYPMDITPGVANFLLCHLRTDAPDAATVVARCRKRNLFIRNATTMGRCFNDRTLRIAVKDEETNQRMLEILLRSLTES